MHSVAVGDGEGWALPRRSALVEGEELVAVVGPSSNARRARSSVLTTRGSEAA
jgi:hypothetical protein